MFIHHVPYKSNCLFWARRQYRRHGGYIAVRRSSHSPLVKHRFWSPDMVTWYSYSPINPKKGWRVLFDCFWFRGYVEVGDDGC